MLTKREKKLIDAAKNRGVRLLDQRVPGWRKLVKARVDEMRWEHDGTNDPVEFDMEHVKRCTLGCIFGDYERGLEALGIRGLATGYGFKLADTIFAKEAEVYWNKVWLRAARVRT